MASKIKLDTRYLRSVLFYIIAAALSILVIVYLCYHLFGTGSDSVLTEPAQRVVYTDDLVADGYIFKTESVLYTQYEGSISHLYADGQRVAKDAQVASVYSSEHSVSHTELHDIDLRLSILTRSNKTAYTQSDMRYVDAEINRLFYGIRDQVESGSTEYLDTFCADFLVYLNQREIINNRRLNFNTEIAELQAQRERLLRGGQGDEIGPVRANVSGNYYSGVDGFENIFTSSKVDTLTISSFDELTARSPEPLRSEAGTACGKLMTDYVWYLGCKADKRLSDHFKAGNTYSVSFPQDSDAVIDMELYRVESDASEDQILLIFRSTVTPSGFRFDRCQTVRIAETTAAGYRVPTSAVRVVEGETGVYILKENVVRFKKVDILLEKDGYYLVAENDPQKEDSGDYLSAFDSIIVSGRDLYDGKVIGA